MRLVWRRGVASAAIVALGLVAASTAAAQAPHTRSHPGSDLVGGRLIVRFAPGLGRSAQRSVASRLGGNLDRRLGIASLAVVATPDVLDPRRAARRLAAQPGVLYAEPDQQIDFRAIPNDPLFGRQWALLNSGQRILAAKGRPGADVDAPPPGT